MPKKNSSWGQNSKAVEARERKANEKREEQTKKQKAVDDAYWKDDNKLDGRKKERKDTAEQKKQDALKRKEEAKKLLEAEEAKLGGTSKKIPSGATKKVTQFEIDKVKEKDKRQQELLAQEKEKEQKKLSENPEMEEENPNIKMAQMLAAEGAVEARSMNDAIGVLSISDKDAVDRHPEKRMKAAYLEFEERELPRLKAEYSNMRLSQLKQMLRKEWQKSPDNPMNQR